MRRSTLNFIIDLVGFVMLLGLIVTGTIMKYVLPPGTGGRGWRLHGGRGGEHIKTLLSMSRHDWGDIHFYIAVCFVALMIVHTVLHWGWIKNYFKLLVGIRRKA